MPDYVILIAYHFRDKDQHHPSTHHPRLRVSSCVRWSLSTELTPLSLIRRSGRFSLRPRLAGQLGDVGRLQKIRFYMIANTLIWALRIRFSAARYSFLSSSSWSTVPVM